MIGPARFLPRERSLLRAAEPSSAGTHPPQEFLLPWSSQPHFADLFEQIEQERENLGVDSFGVFLTTLEEVFVKLSYEEQSDDDRGSERAAASLAPAPAPAGRLGSVSEASPGDVELGLLPPIVGSGVVLDSPGGGTGGGGGGEGRGGDPAHPEGAAGVARGAPWTTQVRALLRRRFLMSRRDLSLVCQAVLVPLIAVLISGVFSAIPALDTRGLRLLPLSAARLRPPEPLDVRTRAPSRALISPAGIVPRHLPVVVLALLALSGTFPLCSFPRRSASRLRRTKRRRLRPPRRSGCACPGYRCAAKSVRGAARYCDATVVPGRPISRLVSHVCRGCLRST